MQFDAHRIQRLGVMANLAAVAGMAVAWAYSQPLFVLGDEMAHLDYAYQIWQGRWPVFENGLQVDAPYGYRPPVQWTAQHPPLYYLIQAPFVGPWLSAGNVLMAGYAGRAINTVIAVALVGAIMWAAAALAPGRKALWLGAGTVAALYPVVVETAATMYSDLLLALWSTLLVGLTARMVHRGPSALRLVLFAIVAGCALLSRSAGGPVIAACGVTLIVVFLVRRPRSWPGVGGVVAAVAFAVAVSGWFYLRNLQLTGNLAGGHFDYLTHRIRLPLSQTLMRAEVWNQLMAIHGYNLVNNVLASVLLVGLPLGAGVIIGLRHLLRRRRLVPDVALAMLLIGLAAGIVMMQMMYVSSGGGASMRYLGPITVVISFGVAVGLNASRRTAPLLVGAWTALAFIPSAAFALSSLGVPPQPRVGPVFVLPTVAGLVVAVLSLLVVIGVQMGVAGYFTDVIRLPDDPHSPHRAQVEPRHRERSAASSGRPDHRRTSSSTAPDQR